MDILNRHAFRTLFTLLPKSALSSVVGSAVRMPAPRALHTSAARAFASHYGVRVDEAELPIDEYPTFGAFFTRKLKPGLRPIAEGADVVVSPVDGVVAAAGLSEQGRMVQAKGRDYSLAALLDDPIEARHYEGGAYLTIYLSPRDYHRIHCPLRAEIEGYRYIPGKLFPVNPPSVRSVPNLFCVNERLTTYLKTDFGRVAVVKVGATCVGRVRASYDDVATRRPGGSKSVRYERPIPVEKGAELGVFEMGSTVILLFEPGRARLDCDLREGSEVLMGEAIARGEASGAAPRPQA